MAEDSEPEREPASQPKTERTSNTKPKPPTFDVVRRRGPFGGKKAKGAKKKAGKKR